MPAKRILTAVFGALIALLTSLHAAYANDASYGGSASALRPLTESRVQMVSENIIATLEDDDVFHVRATYRFHNPTSESLPLALGFPEPCEWNADMHEALGVGGDVRPLRFTDLRTWVNGAESEVRIGQTERPPGPTEYGDLCRVFLTDVTMAAEDTTTVRHEYRYTPTSGRWHTDFHYVTRTGALWSGPIGSASFTVRIPWWPSAVEATPETRHMYRRWGRRGFEGSWTFLEWTPSGDFDVSLQKADLYDAFEARDEALGQCPPWRDVVPTVHGQPVLGVSNVRSTLRTATEADLLACAGWVQRAFLRLPDGNPIPEELADTEGRAYLAPIRLEQRRRQGTCIFPQNTFEWFWITLCWG